jgi:hypothetical protein
MAVLVEPLKEMLMHEPVDKKKVIVFCKDKETLAFIDEVFRNCTSCQALQISSGASERDAPVRPPAPIHLPLGDDVQEPG